MPASHRNTARGKAAGPGKGAHKPAAVAADGAVLGYLNAALKNELTAINQYFLHSRMLADWGVSELAHKEHHESIDEMKHADWLIKRLLFLGGLPNLQDIGKLMIGEDVAEIIACDLQVEMTALQTLLPAIQHCEQVKDYVSRDLLVKILESEEEHIDFLQIQQKLIAQIGLAQYIQLQSKPNATGAD